MQDLFCNSYRHYDLPSIKGFSKKSVLKIFIILLEENCPGQWSKAYIKLKLLIKWPFTIEEWTTFVYHVFKTGSPYERNPHSHFSQKAISVHIFISKIRFVFYSYWVHGFICFLRKPLLHFCTLSIIYHMSIAKKWETFLVL